MFIIFNMLVSLFERAYLLLYDVFAAASSWTSSSRKRDFLSLRLMALYERGHCPSIGVDLILRRDCAG